MGGVAGFDTVLQGLRGFTGGLGFGVRVWGLGCLRLEGLGLGGGCWGRMSGSAVIPALKT